MSNDYFNNTTSTLVNGTLARATTVESKFSAVASGFDKFPSQENLTLDKTTYGIAGGSINAYELTLSNPPSSYVTGMRVHFAVPAGKTNTGASTINIYDASSVLLGAKSIKRLNGDALSVGDLTAGKQVTLQYDGTNFILLWAWIDTMPPVSIRASTYMKFDANGYPAVGYSAALVEQAVDAALGNYYIGTLEKASTIAAMTALPKSSLTDKDRLYVMSFATQGDGGDGVWEWRSASTATAVTGMIEENDAGGTGRWHRLYNGAVYIKWGGAKGDGSTDDLAVAQALADFLTENDGGKLVWTKAFYRHTGTLNIGAEILGTFTFITGRTGALNLSTLSTNLNSTNLNANKALAHIELVFEPGAIIIADWTPSTSEEPVIAYNIPWSNAVSRGIIRNPMIISSTFYSGGAFDRNASSALQTNDMIGIFCYSGCSIYGGRIVGTEHGVVAVSSYWQRFMDIQTWRTGGVAFDFSNSNAMLADGLIAEYSAKGMVFDGVASKASTHTEQVAQDWIIYAAGSCEFSASYMEDTSGDDGTGTYSITLGTTENGIDVTTTKIIGVNNGSRRPNKGFARIWSSNSNPGGLIFENCRSYSGTILKDSSSYVTYINCDSMGTSATALAPRTSVKGAGVDLVNGFFGNGSSKQMAGPWQKSVSGWSPGSLAANATAYTDVTTTTTVDGKTVHPHFRPDGTSLTGWTFNASVVAGSPQSVRVTIINTTGSTADPGTIGGSILFWASLN